MKTEQERREFHINVLITMALANEAIRDNAKWESKRYWRYHDAAMRLHEKARQLMPKGS